MPKQLDQNIKIIQLIPIQTISATTNGSAKDTKISEMFNMDTALVNVEIGDITGSPTSVAVKIEEDDDSGFGGATVASGGEEITVSADTSYKMEVSRSKRYLRAVVTITGGTSPTVEVFVGGILWNASKPFPVI
jgi:hypothetical protein